MSKCERCIGKFLLLLQLVWWSGLNFSLWYAELPYIDSIIFKIIVYGLGLASFLLTFKTLISLSFKTIAKNKVDLDPDQHQSNEWEFCNV